MNNRIFITIIGLGILSALIGVIINNVASEIETINLGWNMSYYGLRVGGFIGFIMLLINGTFLTSIYFKFLLAIIPFVIIGILFKIQHYSEYSNHLIIIGLVGIVICYLLSFLKKTNKKRLDYLKLIWVFTTYTCAILFFLHLIKREYSELGNYIMWLTIIDFAISGIKDKTIFGVKPTVNV